MSRRILPLLAGFMWGSCQISEGDGCRTSPCAIKPRLSWMGLWQGQPWKEQFEREMAREFAYLHPELEAELVYDERWTEMGCAAQIAEMIRTGNYHFDIVWMTPRIRLEVGELLANPDWVEEYLVDFYQVEGFEDKLHPAVLKQYLSEPLTGPCIEGRFFVTWYNQNVAAKLGLHIEGPILTYDELLRHTRRVHEYNQTADEPITTILDFQNGSSSRRLFESLLISRIVTSDGRIPDQLDRKRRDAILRATLKALEELSKYDVISPDYKKMVRRTDVNRILGGNALLIFDSSTTLSRFNATALAGDLSGLKFLSLPVFRAAPYALGSYRFSWAVFKNSPERDSAIEFIEHWSTPRVAEQWVRNTKSLTGLKGNSLDAGFINDPFGKYQATICDKEESLIYFPQSLIRKYWKRRIMSGPEFSQKIQSVLAGERTADEVFSQLSH